MNRLKVLLSLIILVALALLLAGQVSGEPAGDDVIVSGAKAMLTKGIARSPELEAATANTEPHSIAMYADGGKLVPLVVAPSDLLALAAQVEPHPIAEYADGNRWAVLADIPAELRAAVALVELHVRYHHSDAGLAKELTYPEALFNDAAPPVISSVRVTFLGSEAVAVLWTTDEFADSRVEYGLTQGAYGGDAADPLYAKEHRLVLRGLTPNAIYYFVITSVDRSGNVASTVEGRFEVKNALYLPLIRR